MAIVIGRCYADAARRPFVGAISCVVTADEMATFLPACPPTRRFAPFHFLPLKGSGECSGRGLLSVRLPAVPVLLFAPMARLEPPVRYARAV